MPDIPGFKPSTSGFAFSNSFPNVPLFTIDVAGVKVPIGDAANGLCGGMVFAARDYYHAGIVPPQDTTPPSTGPLFDFLVRRLFDSFNLTDLPPGPAVYWYLMNPDLPDHETVASTIGVAPHGRAWLMINDYWPVIKRGIDGGSPMPMGLVSIKVRDPFKMGLNHQVLAYGYDYSGTSLTIRVYDPNQPIDDNIAISLDTGDPQHTTPVTYTGTLGGDGRIWCFFPPRYAFVHPELPHVQAQSQPPIDAARESPFVVPPALPPFAGADQCTGALAYLAYLALLGTFDKRSSR